MTNNLISKDFNYCAKCRKNIGGATYYFVDADRITYTHDGYPLKEKDVSYTLCKECYEKHLQPIIINMDIDDTPYWEKED